MPIALPIRASLVFLSLSAPAFAQAIPATAPTSPQPLPLTFPSASAAATAQAPAGQPAHKARVDFATGLVTVTADNSSLNQILRDIGRATGMRITGGVTDERVYGTYGPADTGTVLATLLRGTGSNMLLIVNASQAPEELVLTPRQGGPTPPNPSASRDEPDQSDLPPQRQQRFSRPFGVPNQPPPPEQQPQPQPPPQQQPAPVPEAAAAGTPTPAAPASDTTTQESPNGVKTPQQIYDQLLKMQQQQPKPPAPPL